MTNEAKKGQKLFGNPIGVKIKRKMYKREIVDMMYLMRCRMAKNIERYFTCKPPTDD